MTVHRRTLLKAGALAGIAGANLPLACSSSDAEGGPEVGASFEHGVASGDPTTDSVLLWTRVTPREPGPVSGSFEVFDSLALDEPLTSGSFTTDVCSSCHPFYTGKHKIMDVAGRVDRFRKKYANVSKPQA